MIPCIGSAAFQLFMSPLKTFILEREDEVLELTSSLQLPPDQFFKLHSRVFLSLAFRDL